MLNTACLWPPAPLPARRAYRPEGRAYASEREPPLPPPDTTIHRIPPPAFGDKPALVRLTPLQGQNLSLLLRKRSIEVDRVARSGPGTGKNVGAYMKTRADTRDCSRYILHGQSHFSKLHSPGNGKSGSNLVYIFYILNFYPLRQDN